MQIGSFSFRLGGEASDSWSTLKQLVSNFARPLDSAGQSIDGDIELQDFHLAATRAADDPASAAGPGRHRPCAPLPRARKLGRPSAEGRPFGPGVPECRQRYPDLAGDRDEDAGSAQPGRPCCRSRQRSSLLTRGTCRSRAVRQCGESLRPRGFGRCDWPGRDRRPQVLRPEPTRSRSVGIDGRRRPIILAGHARQRPLRSDRDRVPCFAVRTLREAADLPGTAATSPVPARSLGRKPDQPDDGRRRHADGPQDHRQQGRGRAPRGPPRAVEKRRQGRTALLLDAGLHFAGDHLDRRRRPLRSAFRLASCIPPIEWRQFGCKRIDVSPSARDRSRSGRSTTVAGSRPATRWRMPCLPRARVRGMP